MKEKSIGLNEEIFSQLKEKAKNNKKDKEKFTKTELIREAIKKAKSIDEKCKFSSSESYILDLLSYDINLRIKKTKHNTTIGFTDDELTFINNISKTSNMKFNDVVYAFINIYLKDYTCEHFKMLKFNVNRKSSSGNNIKELTMKNTILSPKERTNIELSSNIPLQYSPFTILGSKYNHELQKAIQIITKELVKIEINGLRASDWTVVETCMGCLGTRILSNLNARNIVKKYTGSDADENKIRYYQAVLNDRNELKTSLQLIRDYIITALSSQFSNKKRLTTTDYRKIKKDVHSHFSGILSENYLSIFNFLFTNCFTDRRSLLLDKHLESFTLRINNIDNVYTELTQYSRHTSIKHTDLLNIIQEYYQKHNAFLIIDPPYLFNKGIYSTSTSTLDCPEYSFHKNIADYLTSSKSKCKFVLFLRININQKNDKYKLANDLLQIFYDREYGNKKLYYYDIKICDNTERIIFNFPVNDEEHEVIEYKA